MVENFLKKLLPLPGVIENFDDVECLFYQAVFVDSPL